MDTPQRVIITIRGGIPECVEQPDGVEVIVHDYDLECYDSYKGDGTRAEEVKTDEDGEEYWEKTI